MAIVTQAEIENFIGITEGYLEEAGQATNDAISSLHSSVEKFVKSYCRKDFEETSYSKEVYYNNGSGIINLKNYPIIYLDRVAIGKRDVLKIRNTNTWSTASVSVSSTGLRLVKDGTADATVLFATYTTISDVITAVNLISGWEAEVAASTYGNIKSTELLDRYAASTIDNDWIWLQIPESAENNIEVLPNEGQISIIKDEYGYYNYGDSRRTDSYGSNAVYVDYTAGYSSANMPEDLKLAIKIMFQYFYNKKGQSGYGIENYTISRLKVYYEKNDFPKEAINILNRYKTMKV